MRCLFLLLISVDVPRLREALSNSLILSTGPGIAHNANECSQNSLRSSTSCLSGREHLSLLIVLRTSSEDFAGPHVRKTGGRLPKIFCKRRLRNGRSFPFLCILRVQHPLYTASTASFLLPQAADQSFGWRCAAAGARIVVLNFCTLDPDNNGPTARP